MIRFDGTKLELNNVWFVELEEEKRIVKMQPFEVQEHSVSYLKALQSFCLDYTANRSAVNPTAFCSVPFQNVIQM